MSVKRLPFQFISKCEAETFKVNIALKTLSSQEKSNKNCYLKVYLILGKCWRAIEELSLLFLFVGFSLSSLSRCIRPHLRRPRYCLISFSVIGRAVLASSGIRTNRIGMISMIGI